MFRIIRAASAAAVLFVAACAAVVPTAPAQLAPVPAGSGETIRVAQVASIRLSTGYTRELPAGSRWERIGALPQGDVYRPVGTVFTIEGRHVHEAYLVIRGDALHGFYLPGESNYSALPSPLKLTLGASS